MDPTLATLHAIVTHTHSTLTEGPLAADRYKMLICSALGLGGEAGEYVDLVKKVYEQGRPLDVAAATKELADVLYYVQLAAMALDTDIPSVVAVLDEKLRKRYPDGFSVQASADRKDVTHG